MFHLVDSMLKSCCTITQSWSMFSSISYKVLSNNPYTLVKKGLDLNNSIGMFPIKFAESMDLDHKKNKRKYGKNLYLKYSKETKKSSTCDINAYKKQRFVS